ncbi:hypothetical protein QA584_17285 [Anaerocolumna sp. AGMB13025]|nr:hypothetical protein [Anaerocolumna sp. AGMB13025]WFR55354.1 hypothetical protein QA584_17285 [Anaerocolumna sp. AGMB13025]
MLSKACTRLAMSRLNVSLEFLRKLPIEQLIEIMEEVKTVGKKN